MNRIQLELGQAAYLTRGLNDNWSPADGRLDILYPPPEQPLETIEVTPPAERGVWDYPTITLHDEVQSLLTELLPYEVISPSAELDATHLPAGALVLGAAQNPDALKTLSATLGVDLLNEDFGFALVKVSRHDGVVRHPSQVGRTLIYARQHSPYGIRESFLSAMSRLRQVGAGVPTGWAEGYDMAAVENTLEFQRTWGTHYVSKVTVGDTILQVFAYPSVQFAQVKAAYANKPEKLKGPDAIDFIYFTTDSNKGEYGYVKEYGSILNLSHCDAFQGSLRETKWQERTWSKTDSIFALFDSSSPLDLPALDRDFKDQVATLVSLASLGVVIEYKRGLYWQRVLKAALAQKYEDTIQVDVRVADDRDFDDMLADDPQSLLSTLATPTINVYNACLDLDSMQIVAADQVKNFTILAQVLSSGVEAPVSIPGSSVRLYAQIFDLRAEKGIGTWTLTDAAFDGVELACDEFMGGLALCNKSRTAYSFILDGLRFGLNGKGRDANPVVVADLRTTPSEGALPSLKLSLQFAMSFMEAALGLQYTCSDCGLQAFTRAGCEWYARFIPSSTTDPELLALRVQSLDLARRVQDPLNGAFVPILPASMYRENFDAILDYAQKIQEQIQINEVKIEIQKSAERAEGVLEALNENIIASGQLLSGLIDASRAQQASLSGHYEGIIQQLEAEAKAASKNVDDLNVALFKAKGDVDVRIGEYETAVAQQQIANAVKFGLAVATDLFTLGASIVASASSAEALGQAAQMVQKTYNAINDLQTFYAMAQGGTNAAEALEDLDGILFGSTSTLPWDELNVQFKAVMGKGPEGSIVAQARTRLEAAFDIMILRGKALMSARASLTEIQRDIYMNTRRKALSDEQAQRLAKLNVALNPVRPEDLDTSAIDLVGLTGELHAVQKQTMAILSSAFVLLDQALQYVNLQPPTLVDSFSVLGFLNARMRQEAATLAAKTLLAQVQPSVTSPIPYEIEVHVDDISGGARLEFDIGLDARQFYQYVVSRVKSVVAAVEGVTSTEGGNFLVELEYRGAPFMDRDMGRDRRNFHTPGRRRSYEYRAATGIPLFTDNGETWSQEVNPITPFSRWAITLPDTSINKGIKFAGQYVKVRLEFVLEARIFDQRSRLRRYTTPLGRSYYRAVAEEALAQQSPRDGLVAASVPTTDALVKHLYSRSCTNNWDVVFNMSLGQINKALEQQYEELKEESPYVNKIEDEFRIPLVEGSYWIQKWSVQFGYPLMTFRTNSSKDVKLTMEIFGGSTIQKCLEVDGEIVKCDPPLTIDGATLNAVLELEKVVGSVDGNDVLIVKLNMEAGTFTVEGISISPEEQFEFNKMVKEHFASNPMEFTINELDISNVPTLEALKPHGFLFKLLRTPSDADMLQMYIQTGNRPLLDSSQMFLNDVPEPLPSGQEASLIVRSELLYSEILPQSLSKQSGWRLEGVKPDSATAAWTSKLTKALIKGDLDLSGLRHVVTTGGGESGSQTTYTYEVKGGNPVDWSLEGIPFESTPEGKIKMEGEQDNRVDYIEHSERIVWPCIPGVNCGAKTQDTPRYTDVTLSALAFLPLEVNGEGRNQNINIEMTSSGVNVSGRMSGGGPCGSDDLEAQVNKLIREQVPAQIEVNLNNLSFDAISVFALKNLLFPADNFIDFKACYAPGDLLLVGTFVRLT